ncbi:MAG: HAMP domain-containing histidine kinase [Prevotellaceae bacterium]|jgi:signal transduction histidine kinase|nr:HAMP domain-containing histidine kinase [Prevotellaceae bacterium]
MQLPRKRLIPLLGFATAVAAFCLVAFQLFWISEARKIKEEAFNAAVNSTLDNIVARMEKDEVAFQVVNDMSPNAYEFMSAKSGIRSLRKEQQQFTVNLYDTTALSKRFSPIADPAVVGQLYDMLLSIDKQQREHARQAIAERSAKEANPEKIKIDDKLRYKKILVDNIVEKFISIEVPIEQRISEPQLDSLIRDEFRQHGLTLDYEFAVRHAEGELLFGHSRLSLTAGSNNYVRQLFPNDLLSERYFLSVAFPHKYSYIFMSMGAMLLASLGLLLIVMGVFLSTLITIMRQKKLSQMRSDFVSNMTHELKTPIATIALASEMLNDANVPSEKKNYANLSGVIYAQTKRLSLLVERTLQLAMFEHGKLHLRLRPCSFHALAAKVLDSFALQAENSGAHIARAFNAASDEVLVDEVHFANIFSNLIDNALKYAKENPLIVVSTKNEGDKLLIQVRDNGIGIPKEDLKRVFEQFYRVHTGNLHNVKGFGLGLNYVKQIVEQLEGQIWVESELGKGTTFNILMPLAIKMEK